MDSITHIALGAVIGEVCAGKKIGKRALLYGAILQSLPDIDVAASLWLSPADDLLVHRGITHSILFALASSALLACLAFRWHRPSGITWINWWLFFALEILTHIFLDAFNNYGTGWLEPFSSARISFNTLFVADPFFTIWVLISCLVLVVLKRKNHFRKHWAIAGLSLSLLYMCYAITNKIIINKTVCENFAQQKLSYKRFFTTPSPLNTWLWYIVAEQDSGYQIAYHSVLDKNSTIGFQYFPRHEELLKPFNSVHDLQQLEKFSQHYFTVGQVADTIIFNDLRFGQIMGWDNGRAPFIFHYYISHPERNLLVIQRGRFTGWNRKALEKLTNRIRGDQTKN